ncbi:MAG: hypothetical protein JNK82_00100 [Myxococcaceae bacterium]|nr:hypothetical protein [Myxococcaceae bacterium]
MRSLLALVALVVAVTACKPGPIDPPDSGMNEPEGCSVSFTHRARSTASTVYVVGEWNQFDRQKHPLKDPGATNTWSGTFKLPPGTWSYVYLENGQEVADDEGSAIRYVEGRAWSALRVADCTKPLLVPQPGSVVNASGSFSIDLAAFEADAVEISLSGPGGPASSSQMAISGGALTYSATGLQPGKYTARLTPTKAGQRGETVLLPFWVEAEPFRYTDSPLYMLMLDRFRNGDTANDNPGPGTARFEGGDLVGLEAAIREGYFDALHVKAIWVSPWQTQPTRVFPDGSNTVSGYHGYWPVKAREVDPRFGGNGALKTMVQEAHRHGIRIVMDAVLNHVHEDHEYFVDPAKRSWFRTGCNCGSSAACGWDNAALTCLFREYMPDIDWTQNAASDQFVSDMVWWMEEFDLDGIRIDAVKHVEDAAIINLTNRVRERFETAGTDYYMFGETFTGDVGTIKRYIGKNKLDGQLNFPLFMQMPETVFGRDDQGMQQVRSATAGSLSSFAGATMVDFVGNHDVARFITKADPMNRDRQGNGWSNLPGAPVGQLPYDRLYLAFAHLMTTPSVPLIYYGDEYGEWGGADPDNRHFLNREATYFPEQRAQIDRMKKLLAARAKLRGLRRGPLVDLWCNNEPWGSGQGNLYAYARTDADPKHSAVIVLNLTTNVWSGVSVTFPPALQWSSGTLREELAGRDIAFTNSTVTVDVPARGAVILSLK